MKKSYIAQAERLIRQPLTESVQFVEPDAATIRSFNAEPGDTFYASPRGNLEFLLMNDGRSFVQVIDPSGGYSQWMADERTTERTVADLRGIAKVIDREVHRGVDTHTVAKKYLLGYVNAD